MKYLISTLVFLLVFQLQAQDPYFQRNNETIEETAKELTKIYNSELALNGKQPLLFQKKVEEFLIREKDIRKQFSGKEMLDLLYKLRITETGEMANILTRPQLNLYKKIKPIIQPLEIVEDKQTKAKK
ncbi:hypothetical protein [Flavisericum labens]|uniref:hypothetical protein n=1 Tax=Flavisericum labens TaxID=3377112 RepID=UPI00387B83A4